MIENMRLAGQRLICKVFYAPETNLWGRSYQFEGEEPHYRLDSCPTLLEALAACDPHKERVWDQPDGSDPNVKMISYGYQFGTANWICDGSSLQELHQRRMEARAATI